MNIFGVGEMELVIILILMLVVAGPKRMVKWAYVLGQYTAKLRGMWTETVGYLQKEFDEAGLDVQLPKTPPTKATLNQTIVQAMKPLTKSLEDPLKEPLKEVNRVKDMATIDMGVNGSTGNGNGKVQTSSAPSTPAAPPAPTTPPSPPSDSPSSGLGTWSGGAPTSTSEDKPQ